MPIIDKKFNVPLGNVKFTDGTISNPVASNRGSIRRTGAGSGSMWCDIPLDTLNTKDYNSQYGEMPTAFEISYTLGGQVGGRVMTAAFSPALYEIDTNSAAYNAGVSLSASGSSFINTSGADIGYVYLPYKGDKVLGKNKKLQLHMPYVIPASCSAGYVQINSIDVVMKQVCDRRQSFGGLA